MLDQYGLPRRELGLAFFGSIIVLVLVVLLIDPMDNNYGLGSMITAFACGVAAAGLLIWTDKLTSKSFFPASLEERVARYEKYRRFHVTSFIPVAIVVIALNLIPDRYESLVLAFAAGGLTVLLAWFIVDRWIVLPRQLDEVASTEN